MEKRNQDNLSGIEVLLVIFSTFIGLVILTFLLLKFVYPPEFFQTILAAITAAKEQILQLSKIIGPFFIGLIFLLIGTIIEEKHRKKIFSKVKEKSDAENLINKQLNPTDDNLFRILDEEPSPKSEKEKEYFTRKEKENSIKRKVEMELAEVDEENLSKPSKKNFIPEFPNVYFYAEDDEIHIEQENEDLLSKVQDLGPLPEVKTSPMEDKIEEKTTAPVIQQQENVQLKKTPVYENLSTDDVIDQIIDSFAEDMEKLPLDLDNGETVKLEKEKEFKKEDSKVDTSEKIISSVEDISDTEELTYPDLILKPVEVSPNQIAVDLDKEDLEIIGNDSQPKGIIYKSDLKKNYFTFEKYIKEELSSAKRLEYEICFFTIDSNKELSDKLSKDFKDGCECFILKNKVLFILPFYNKLEVTTIIDKYNFQYTIIGKKNDYEEIKEALAI